MPARGMKRRILIVDDDPHIRMVLRLLLESTGFEVLDVENGRGGLGLIVREALAGQMIHGVLLDIHLPDLDGITVLREIRDRHPAIPVVVVTGDQNQETVAAVLESGAVACLFKPFGDPHDLQARCLAVFAAGMGEGDEEGTGSASPNDQPTSG